MHKIIFSSRRWRVTMNLILVILPPLCNILVTRALRSFLRRPAGPKYVDLRHTLSSFFLCSQPKLSSWYLLLSKAKHPLSIPIVTLYQHPIPSILISSTLLSVSAQSMQRHNTRKPKFSPNRNPPSMLQISPIRLSPYLTCT